MLFGDDVSEIPLAAWQRFRQDRLGIGIQKRHTRSRCPWLEQHVGIFDGRRPDQRVSIPVQALRHVQARGRLVPLLLDPRSPSSLFRLSEFAPLLVRDQDFGVYRVRKGVMRGASPTE